ncbi:hypothetical protein FACS189440_11630 [Bacteroidia bacterium]|nr:hypothetical protein FACS189440_11630 [Bacteroidia bacterium]
MLNLKKKLQMKKIFTIACVAMLFMAANLFGQEGNRSLQIGSVNVALDKDVTYTITHDNASTEFSILRDGTEVADSPFDESDVISVINSGRYPDRTVNQMSFWSAQQGEWTQVMGDEKAWIFWNDAPADPNFIKSEVEYTKVDGTTATLDVYKTAVFTELPEAEQKMLSHRYRSVYLIEETGELYYGEWKQWTFPKISLFLVGYMMPGGFDPAAGQELYFDEENPWVYTFTYNMAAWSSFRYLNQRSFSGWNVRPAAGGIPVDWVMDGTTRKVRTFDIGLQDGLGLPSDDNNFFTGEGGNYKVTLDLNELTITYEKLD